jgi:hypothetical protein
MPNNPRSFNMRMLLFCCLIPLAAFAAPAMSAVSEPTETGAPSLSLSLADLQARFADLQRQARMDGELFELRLVGAGQDLLEQVNDGIVRLPEDWVVAAPDRETLDFLMLLGLADAIARKPAPQDPGSATKIVTGTLGWIAANATDNRRRLDLSAPRFDSNASPREPTPALRALNWTTATGGCEAQVIFGLRQLEAMNGPIGRNARQILKALGPVAWTPNDQCGPQGR